MNSYIIGIDIGGTNTDGVLVDKKGQICSQIKIPTSQPVGMALDKVLSFLCRDLPAKAILRICVGTTHAINALLEKKNLFRVGLIRLCGHHPQSIPAAFLWPKELKQAAFAGVTTIDGGFDCDGKALRPFKTAQLRGAVHQLLDMGAEGLAITGCFSPLFPDQEILAEACAREIVREGFPITLSHQLGGVGFLERENAAIVNTALVRSLKTGFADLQAICRAQGIDAPLFFTQNNGSLLDLDSALKTPLLTLSAGPTNSFIGASRLSGVSHALVVDIGGTSTDVGMVRQGFPVRSYSPSMIEGIRLQVAMPLLCATGLGGGSHILRHENGWKIGPQSCAKQLTKMALCFSGSQLTLTDAAVRLFPELIAEANVSKVSLNDKSAKEILSQADASIDALVQKVMGKENLPVLFVGGGAKLFSQFTKIQGAVFPQCADVANAFGAALAEVTGTVDTVISLENRDTALEELTVCAKEKAIQAGANPQAVRVIDKNIIPYHYTPGKLARVLISVAGPHSNLACASI